MRFKAIIFDFDGVIADSEVIANVALAEFLSQNGSPTTLDQALDRYCGKRWSDCLPLIEEQCGRTFPEGTVERLVDEAVETLADQIKTIDGVAGFVETQAHRNRAIASSSARDWLDRCLERFRLDHHFGEHVYSAAGFARGKPYPDIYLHVAQQLSVAPEKALVIEDSPTGAAAGSAAGMTVVGLLAGGHIRDGHDEKLKAAGAHHIVSDYRELGSLLAAIEA
ncbi:HAD family phosphatase [Parasphingopyxis sp.]|uniref:HAD family hydrolase n=1 Tax=Parasphingopyxis sp. TaxID=1920299 RepID=UPI00262F6715|nr:HAD family phosphatase [Parasphingopyxis sp.]